MLRLNLNLRRANDKQRHLAPRRKSNGQTDAQSMQPSQLDQLLWHQPWFRVRGLEVVATILSNLDAPWPWALGCTLYGGAKL